MSQKNYLKILLHNFIFVFSIYPNIMDENEREEQGPIGPDRSTKPRKMFCNNFYEVLFVLKASARSLLLFPASTSPVSIAKSATSSARPF